MRRSLPLGLAHAGAVLALSAVAGGQVLVQEPQALVQDPLWRDVVVEADGVVLAADPLGVQAFPSWSDYFASDWFRDHDKRCGVQVGSDSTLYASTGDCTDALTNPAAEYDPSGAHYTVPVVVHVLQHPNGAGFLSDAQVQSQIEVLNEDFQALPGSLGAPGNDVNVSFVLAGITRSTKASWFNDSGSYWSSLAWDTTQYLNVYTNTAGGYLGYAYVPNGGGVVGNTWDRVVIHYQAFGKPAIGGPPYDLGRTATHEVGHYLGLYHTFQGGCASASGCYANGDLICDTNPEGSPNYSPCDRSSCGSVDPTHNYLDYSDDVCMYEFTPEQARRIRCTIEGWRPGLIGTGGPSAPDPATDPSPADGATGVAASATLSWSAGAGADSHDVYLGTDPTPDAGELVGNQTGTTYDPGGLAAGTTYYWRIDEVGAGGTTTGAVWSFTTATGGGGGPALSASGYKVKGKWHADLAWSGLAGSQVDVFRDGAYLTTTANDGAYTDATTFKGGGSLTYRVCETGGGACTNEATVTF